MNSHSFDKSILRLLALAGFLSLCVLLQASDKPSAAKRSAELVIPKSTFTDDVRSGKDPFFPNSTRRLALIPQVVRTNDAVPTTSSFALLPLFLKGISGTKAQPLALINGATVAQGETAEIRCGAQLVKIRCLSIRERSVVLELDSSKEVREIKLREGI